MNDKANIDVLAVLDEAIAMVSGEWSAERLALELEDARAAVAELIEADREYDAVKDEHDDCAKSDDIGLYVPREIYDLMNAAIYRRNAALARVTGASK